MLPALLLALPIASAAVQASATVVPPPLPSDPIDADWRAIPDDDVLIMTFAGGRRVAIRLAPNYAPAHVENVRRLARAHWWDGTSVYRVQDNWVVQWGGAPTDTEQKPLPLGIVERPAAEFDIPSGFRPAQYLARPDAYSAASGITADGWAIAKAQGTTGAGANVQVGYLAHCYGTVGVARDALPDTGTGGELFMPLGGSARRLDRNYTIVGRVIEGAAYLSGLPRSDAPMGVYATAAEQLPIVRVELARDMPADARPHYQYRAADNPRFRAMLSLRSNPAAPTVALGGVDVCDVPLATRRMP